MHNLQTTIYLDEDLKKMVKIYCLNENITMNWFIIEAIKEKINKEMSNRCITLN